MIRPCGSRSKVIWTPPIAGDARVGEGQGVAVGVADRVDLAGVGVDRVGEAVLGREVIDAAEVERVGRVVGQIAAVDQAVPVAVLVLDQRRVGHGKLAGHAGVGDECGRREEQSREAALRLRLEREPLALAAGERDVDVRAVDEGVEDPELLLVGRRRGDAGAQVGVAVFEPPAIAEVVLVAGVERVVGARQRDRDARDGTRDR